MRTWIHPLTVYLDTKGNLEIEGIDHGTSESDRIAQELGIDRFLPLDVTVSSVRSEGLDAATVARVRAWAESNGHTLEEQDDLGPATWSNPAGLAPHLTTIDAVHQHSLEPTPKEKILVPVVLVVVAALLVSVAMVTFDHMNQSYRTAASVGDLVLAAGRTVPERAGVAALLNPPDESFVAVEVRSWDYWAGRGAVSDGHYIHLPELDGPVEALVKDNRGAAATLTLRVDTARSNPPKYHVTEIRRGGNEVVAENLTAEILPLPEVSTPLQGTFPGDTPVRMSQPATWQSLDRLDASGYLMRTPDGFRLRSRNYAVDVAAPQDPLLMRMLEEAALDDAELAIYDQAMAPKPKVSLPSAKRVRLYVEFTGPGSEEVLAQGVIRGARMGNLLIQP